MDIRIHNFTGVDVDVQVANISRRGGNVPHISHNISRGESDTFELGAGGYLDTYSVMTKSEKDSKYMVMGDFRLDSRMMGNNPTLVLAVDRETSGSDVMDFSRSTRNIRYFAKCVDGTMRFAETIEQDDWEDIIEDDPSSVFGLVCRSRGLTYKNISGADPLECGFPFASVITGGVIGIIFIVLLFIILLIIVGAVGVSLYRYIRDRR